MSKIRVMGAAVKLVNNFVRTHKQTDKQYCNYIYIYTLINKSNLRQLGELQVEMIELKRNHEEHIVTWEKERGMADKRREELKARVTGLQSDISRVDHLHKEAIKRKEKEITRFEDRLRDRHNDLTGIKIELEDKKKDLKEIQKLLEISKKRAEDAEKMVEELK